MVGAVGLRFKILEPMMFRKWGEFDPSSRGVFSSATSLSLPTPSTIAGAIATLIVSQSPGLKPSGETWEEELSSVLGSAELRGPYLLKGGELFAACGERGIRLRELPGLAEIYWSLLEAEPKTYEEWTGRLRRLEEFKGRLPALGRLQERVGVGLKRRTEGIKVADEERGLLYTATYIDYITSPGDAGSVAICVDARGLELELGGGKPIKLGGEGRVSVLVKSEETVFNAVKSQLWGGGEAVEGFVALYLASPALFRCGLSREGLEGRIRDRLSQLCGAELEGLAGSTAIMGAGFSLHKGRRKPIYLALEPGSVVFANFPKQCPLEKVYWHSISEVGGQLGYGTAVPVPLRQCSVPTTKK